MLSINSRKDLRVIVLSVVFFFVAIVVLVGLKSSSNSSSRHESSTVYAASPQTVVSPQSINSSETLYNKLYRATMSNSPSRHEIFEENVRNSNDFSKLRRLSSLSRTTQEQWEVMDKLVNLPNLDHYPLVSLRTQLISIHQEFLSGYFKKFDSDQWKKDLAVVNQRIALMEQ